MLFSCWHQHQATHTHRETSRLLSSRVLSSESFSYPEMGDTYNAYSIAAWGSFIYLFVHLFSISMLPRGSLAEGLALTACTRQQVLVTTLLCNIKAQFQYPGRLDFLLRGKICRYLFACKILSLHAFGVGKWWGKPTAPHCLPSKIFTLWATIDCAWSGCEHRCCHTCPVEIEVPASPLCSLPLSHSVPDLWGCWVLTPLRMHRRCHCTTSEMGIPFPSRSRGEEM